MDLKLFFIEPQHSLGAKKECKVAVSTAVKYSARTGSEKCTPFHSAIHHLLNLSRSLLVCVGAMRCC